MAARPLPGTNAPQYALRRRRVTDLSQVTGGDEPTVASTAAEQAAA